MAQTPAVPQPSALAAFDPRTNPALANLYPAPSSLPAPDNTGGMVWLFPRIQANVKDKINGREQLVNGLVCDDAADRDTYMVPATAFRRPFITVAPIAGILRHLAWRNGQKVSEVVGQTNCPFCSTSTPGDRDNRDDDVCEVVVAVLDGNPARPAGMKFVGFYTVQASSTAFQDIYNWYVWQMLRPAASGFAPWAYTYCLTFQFIQSKKTNYSWNVYRIVRTQDDLASHRWYRERRNDDGSVEEAQYARLVTPDHIVNEINQRLAPGTLESAAIALLGRKSDDAAPVIRAAILKRGGGTGGFVSAVPAAGPIPAAFTAPAPVGAAAGFIPPQPPTGAPQQWQTPPPIGTPPLQQTAPPQAPPTPTAPPLQGNPFATPPNPPNPPNPSNPPTNDNPPWQAPTAPPTAAPPSSQDMVAAFMQQVSG
jgi:hypothetical protein